MKRDDSVAQGRIGLQQRLFEGVVNPEEKALPIPASAEMTHVSAVCPMAN